MIGSLDESLAARLQLLTKKKEVLLAKLKLINGDIADTTSVLERFKPTDSKCCTKTLKTTR